MRPLATRRITALAISAVITLGTAGPAIAGEHHPSIAADRAARAPLPDAAALLTQAEALGELGSVTTPVTDLVRAALKADAGQLPAADAEALKAKIAEAVAQAKATAPALPDTPAAPPAADLPVTPPAADLPVAPPAVETPADLPAVPPVEAPALPVKPPVGLPVAAGAKAAWSGRAAAPADVVADALATVEKAVAALLAAVTSGDAGGVVPQVTATLTSLVNLAVATVLGSGLPAPDLAGLPALPALPAAVPDLPVDPPELPVDPPELPVDTPVKPPVDVPELPVKPPLPVR
ncbi:hypothetical protein [Streptomyces zaomyceticus]|uniref:hypothetical protein n=1 Tax=Streptomyces zaomyceticus TaxID=68286 RepID=UPI002E15CCD4|nr:hypothetical protein OG237_27225 [Streptomyces zaomyceticus]